MKNIYKIVNTENDMVYIGCTKLNIRKRFMQHKSESKKARSIGKPLYDAMRKHGTDKFSIELLEICNDEDACKKEREWIKKYKVENRSYNIALGGAGRPVHNRDKICKMLEETPYPYLIANAIGCSKDLVYTIAKENNIDIRNASQELNVNAKRKVVQYSKCGDRIRAFQSIKEAIDWCCDNGRCKSQRSGARGHISECALGKRQSAYGYRWKYQ